MKKANAERMRKRAMISVEREGSRTLKKEEHYPPKKGEPHAHKNTNGLVGEKKARKIVKLLTRKKNLRGMSRVIWDVVAMLDAGSSDAVAGSSGSEGIKGQL